MPVPAYMLAVKKEIFGEGAERMVSKLRYLDKEYCFKGPKLVAKESRHVLDKSQYRKQAIFHKTFMRTQAIASALAKKFNKDIDALLDLSAENVRKLPRINFLEPIVTEVWAEDGTAEYYLIEPFLEGSYMKYNSNNGFVHGQNEDEVKTEAPDFNGLDLIDILTKMNISSPGLGVIEECDDSAEDDDGRESFDLKDEYFPQTFSHYTYEKSKKRMMVVDLQGIIERKSDGSKSYFLTDPVIHKRNNYNTHLGCSFGRTDRGDKVSGLGIVLASEM